MDCTKRATNFAEHHDRAQDSQSPPPAQWEQGRWRTAQSTATAIRYADPVGMLRIPRAGAAGGGPRLEQWGGVDLLLVDRLYPVQAHRAFGIKSLVKNA